MGARSGGSFGGGWLAGRGWLGGALWLLAAGGALAAAAGSCSAAGNETDVASGGNSSGSGGNGGSGAEGGDLTVGVGGGSGGDESCAVLEEEATARPLNLYIVFDKSSSMAGAKWDSAKAGLGAFVDDPDSTGIRVALRFFPRVADATPACNMNGYKEPTVPYGDLPANAQAIKDALDAETPDGFSTPIFPALGGAILKGIELAQANPTEASAVLLVTDGQPQGPAPMCAGVNPEDPNEIANLAQSGATFNPSVLTYVVGLPGVEQGSANIIAQGGGTGSAIFVGSGNVEMAFREALAEIRGKALPCIYALPEAVKDGNISITKVNVEVTPGANGGDPFYLPYNPSCIDGGWHYDDPDNPSVIILCPDSCDGIKLDFGAKLKIVLGCDTIIN